MNLLKSCVAVQISEFLDCSEEEAIEEIKRSVNPILHFVDVRRDISKVIGFYSKFKDFYTYNSSFFFPIVGLDQELTEVKILLESGADNVFFAPFDQNSLYNKLKNCVGKRFGYNILNHPDADQLLNLTSSVVFRIKSDRIKKIVGNRSLFPPLDDSLINKSLDYLLTHILSLKSGNFHETYLRFSSNLLSEFSVKAAFKNSDSSASLNLIFLRLKDKANASYTISVKFEETTDSTHSSAMPSKNSTLLTQRELEVLNLSKLGVPIKVIAKELEISNRTVERHRANIMKKLDATNIVEAIARLNLG
ncbi:LuxR C-terminal-related transcriptional regulator [Mongoliitalea daihaiensis]|uniref:LuxR C-terminal-related transcriptional regulator n=1 Tax=Mongoliitalea daihaiensis TaxID=2782006 RepID=UPI001F1EBED7|nr:helix-turn-helix transcriptional regulator [Mongoliitalea daihaiensis]